MWHFVGYVFFVTLLLFACFLASVVCTAVRRALCLRRPSTPSGMQWPPQQSALPSAEALSASSACVHAVLLIHVDDD